MLKVAKDYFAHELSLRPWVTELGWEIPVAIANTYS